ncbi:MAG: cobalamin-dependent protein [Pseudomonadota bacterium]
MTGDLSQRIAKAVAGHDSKAMEKALVEAGKAGLSARELLTALSAGLEDARKRLASQACALPEFLLCMEVMAPGLARAGELAAADAGGDKRPGAVIGVVEGDVHDLGKNVVAAVLSACGYRVLDLGRDVPGEKFLAAMESTGARVCALSAMMSTPVATMGKIAAAVRERFPKALILAGGAALDEKLAQNLGADGYAENAVELPALLSRLEEKTRRAYMDYPKKRKVVETGGPGK